MISKAPKHDRHTVLMLVYYVGIFLFLPFGCATGVQQSAVSSSDGEFRVIVASAQTGTPLSGATVATVSDDGTLNVIAKTDDSGSATFPKNQLEHVILLVVCHPAHFCGALRVGEGYELSLSYDEVYIELAVVAVI